jgi:hypothetical protein
MQKAILESRLRFATLLKIMSDEWDINDGDFCVHMCIRTGIVYGIARYGEVAVDHLTNNVIDMSYCCHRMSHQMT